MSPGAERTLAIERPDDIVTVRQAVRALARQAGLGEVDQTRVMTAASELARNALHHGGGGTATMGMVTDGDRRGVRLEILDTGPGILDTDDAFRDGFSTAGGLGLGLGGARRLVDEFRIESGPTTGTRITIVKWIR